MANARNKNKRLKCFGIPIETCVKYERLAGVATGATPTKNQSEVVTRLMVNVLSAGVSNVALTSADYQQIAKEVESNERKIK